MKFMFSTYVQHKWQGMVEYICNPSTGEVDTRGLPQIQGQCGLHNELEDSQNYIAKPYLKKT